MNRVKRRAFLAGVGSAALLGGGYAITRSGDHNDADVFSGAQQPSPDGGSTSTAPVEVPRTTVPVDPAVLKQRRLVVLELTGGIDTLSTLVPYSQGTYRDLRPTLALPDEQLLRWDDEVALHPNLSRLNARGIAAIEGIGAINPAGSHFQMIERWWTGKVELDGASDVGFFGRVCDALGSPEAPFVGVTLGQGKHAAMLASSVQTLGLTDLNAVSYLADLPTTDVVADRFQQAVRAMANGSRDGGLGSARTALARAIAAADQLGGLPETTVSYPQSRLANDLATTARMLAANGDLRVVYVPVHLNFDTHVNHNEVHARNLDIIDQAVDAFLSDIEQRGLADSVLVATVSEFGRRPKENGELGVDHGHASVAFLMGKPVTAGRYGEYSSLTDLDGEGNLKPTVTFDRYYATLAETWLGIPSAQIFGTDVSPIDNLAFA